MVSDEVILHVARVSATTVLLVLLCAGVLVSGSCCEDVQKGSAGSSSLLLSACLHTFEALAVCGFHLTLACH